MRKKTPFPLWSNFGLTLVSLLLDYQAVFKCDIGCLIFNERTLNRNS